MVKIGQAGLEHRAAQVFRLKTPPAILHALVKFSELMSGLLDDEDVTAGLRIRAISIRAAAGSGT